MKQLTGAVLVLVFAPLVGAIHFFVYSPVLGHYLYQLVGGTSKHDGWTHYGGAPFAWVIPLQLPGTFLLSRDNLGSTGDTIGKALVLAASVAVGYCAASLALALMSKQRHSLRMLDWRVATIVLGMIWIPVPETLSLIYQAFVRY